MDIQNITGQAFGILGLVLMFFSYQSKSNSKLFLYQALSGLSFAINFFLINDLSAGLFNLVNLYRGAVLSKSHKRLWEVVSIQLLYTACFVFSLAKIWGNTSDVLLSCLTFSALAIMTVVMWKQNPGHIRYAQLFYVSPVWLANNVVHFTLGGILCEIFAMASVVISFIRYRKDGFAQ